MRKVTGHYLAGIFRKSICRSR